MCIRDRYGSIPLHTGTTLSDLIRRPELDYDKLAEIDTDRPDLPAEVTAVSYTHLDVYKRQIMRFRKVF